MSQICDPTANTFTFFVLAEKTQTRPFCLNPECSWNWSHFCPYVHFEEWNAMSAIVASTPQSMWESFLGSLLVSRILRFQLVRIDLGTFSDTETCTNHADRRVSLCCQNSPKGWDFHVIFMLAMQVIANTSNNHFHQAMGPCDLTPRQYWPRRNQRCFGAEADTAFVKTSKASLWPWGPVSKFGRCPIGGKNVKRELPQSAGRTPCKHLTATAFSWKEEKKNT